MNERTWIVRVTFAASSNEQTFSSRAILAQDFIGYSADGGEVWDFTTDSENALCFDLDHDASVENYRVTEVE